MSRGGTEQAKAKVHDQAESQRVSESEQDPTHASDTAIQQDVAGNRPNQPKHVLHGQTEEQLLGNCRDHHERDANAIAGAGKNPLGHGSDFLQAGVALGQ